MSGQVEPGRAVFAQAAGATLVVAEPFGPPFGASLTFSAARVAAALTSTIERAVGKPERALIFGEALGRALARGGLSTIVADAKPRRRRKGPPAVAARPDAPPFADGSLDVVACSGFPPGGAATLARFRELVRDGGLVAVCAASPSLSRRSLPRERVAAALIHAVLVDVEQQVVGSVLIATGRARRP